ncbi:MAG TPA: hypothetical protein VHM91_12075 [Verrucomicrobiales bacterium]|nr:hypothetical protein [Verrucomicrobiales bacterium]
MTLSATLTTASTAAPQGMRLWVPGACDRQILSASEYGKNHEELDPSQQVSGQTNSV